ncbi:glycosyltransferase [Actinomyces sp. 2119]|uniref:Glucosyl-3-phosphoglycerate synthase n=1 Tax=Actinomyces lilanjuaniae TaxID=2321394 RepID=A0ABN5PQW6_9ACTO|nr:MULTISPECIES: glycosyltransferase [Actinomyces]AYD88926.1 glycosyltransferase [Actinomyces lilanjuaniae]RJF43753.1 glycosyltransferase [Actinomyces sp. 2119]
MSSTKCPDQRVAVIVPAKDEAQRIAATVRACRSIPRVDLVVVVDDGSVDGTQDHARAAGAVTVRHSVTRGKASALETGASVVGMRDYVHGPARLLLFIDADLGDSAAACADLVPPVVDGVCDMSVAVPPRQHGAGGRGRVVHAARRAIARATGWEPVAPLSGQRCLSRKAYEKAAPLAEGWGVEVGLTIDVLVAGMAVIEVPCDITHRVTGNDRAGVLHRAAQYKDVVRAVAARTLRRHRVPAARYEKAAQEQNAFHVYRAHSVRTSEPGAGQDGGQGGGASTDAPAGSSRSAGA